MYENKCILLMAAAYENVSDEAAISLLVEIRQWNEDVASALNVQLHSSTSPILSYIRSMCAVYFVKLYGFNLLLTT